MNDYQLQLYMNLVTLTQQNEAFYFQDFEHEGAKYRIFNYRLASYTDFLLPGAIECRGIMFEMSTDPNYAVRAIRLASLPMEKFFNLNENPMTMNLNLVDDVVEIQEKADGSLMSTYLHNGELRLKSKGSISSDQALAAMKWLERMPELKDALLRMAELNFTVNLEWCSPEHRIVLGYLEPTLKVLNMRDNDNGMYVYHWREMSSTLSMHAVASEQVDNAFDFVQSIPSMTDVEGFVLRLKSGQRVKVKCDWYLSLHHAKDSVNNPRRLFECILDEGIDDIRSMFYADPLAMKTIDQMQIKVDHLYNEMVKTVEAYYEANKDLDRKEYAIKGQKELPQMYFGLAMNKYTGKKFDYKQFLKSKWRDLGLKDTSLETE